MKPEKFDKESRNRKNKPSSKNGKYFLSQKQMKEYRWFESMMFAEAKREKRKVRSYYGHICSCGCGSAPVQYPENYPYKWQNPPSPPVPAQPKKPTKRSKKTHPMFSGNIIS